MIYRAHNKTNDKSYVGQTSQTLERRIKGHQDPRNKTIFSKALKKWGVDAFEWTILDNCITSKDADEKERFYINKFYSHYKKSGYNQSIGGASRRGWKHKQSTKAKMRGRVPWNKGLTGLCSPWNRGKSGWTVKSPKRQQELREQVSTQMRLNSYAKGNTNQRKAVRCIDTNKIYPSAYHARKDIDGRFERSEISSVCRGLRNTAFGLRWEFLT